MKRLLAALALTALLSACGGGSSSAPTAPTEPSASPSPPPAQPVALGSLNLIQNIPPAYDARNTHFTIGQRTYVPMVALDQGGFYDIILYVFDQSGAISGGAFVGTATMSQNPTPTDLTTFMTGIAARLQVALNPNVNPQENGVWTVSNPPASLGATSVVTGTPTTVKDIPNLAWTSDQPLAQDVSLGLLFLQFSVVDGSIVVSYP